MPWIDPEKRRAERLTEQSRYGQQIVAWLRQNFADLCASESGRPHPAAITAVLHLHQRYGRGSLTPEDHGAEIRDYVARFEELEKESENAS